MYKTTGAIKELVLCFADNQLARVNFGRSLCGLLHVFLSLGEDHTAGTVTSAASSFSNLLLAHLDQV